MYCTKCGKEIQEGSICDACAAAAYKEYIAESAAAQTQTVCNETEEINTMPDPNNRMYGFGKAIVSVILSEIGAILAIYALVFCLALLPDVALVLSFMALPLIIIPIIFGVKSINIFKARKATCAKPIPTLILGIVGLSSGIVTAILNFLAFIIATNLLG